MDVAIHDRLDPYFVLGKLTELCFKTKKEVKREVIFQLRMEFSGQNFSTHAPMNIGYSHITAANGVSQYGPILRNA
jgi:hypothetical protein